MKPDLSILEKSLTHHTMRQVLIVTQTEQAGPGPALTSVLFKLLHLILSTAERILAKKSPHCTTSRRNEAEPLIHVFYLCKKNHGVGAVLLNWLRYNNHPLTSSNVLTLDLKTSEENEFPHAWTTVSSLTSLWQLKTKWREWSSSRSDPKWKLHAANWGSLKGLLHGHAHQIF